MHTNEGNVNFSYNLVFLSVTYVVPMSVMVWAYAQMSSALRGHGIGECTHHQMQIVRAKRKVHIIIVNKNITNPINQS